MPWLQGNTLLALLLNVTLLVLLFGCIESEAQQMCQRYVEGRMYNFQEPMKSCSLTRWWSRPHQSGVGTWEGGSFECISQQGAKTSKSCSVRVEANGYVNRP